MDHSKFGAFANVCIDELMRDVKIQTANSYTSAFRRFMMFMGGKDLLLSEVNSKVVLSFKEYLVSEGVLPNTVAYYVSALRSVYNKAVRADLVVNRHPFDVVSTAVTPVKINALDFRTIKQIQTIDLSSKPLLAFARDMFLFSFYTRGMAYCDMALLLIHDVHSGVLTYEKKTLGTKISIKIEPCIQDIIERYSSQTVGTEYLLPIVVGTKKGSSDYRSAVRALNARLKKLAAMLELDFPLTSAVARHSWAAIALQRGVPYQTISRCLGRNTEELSKKYLRLLEQNIMDNANKLVIC